MFTLHFLKEIFQDYEGKMADVNIEKVITDSREKAENALFIPIIGDTFNGHDFLKQAIDNGAIATLWDKSVPVPEAISESFCFFFTEDTTEGMQRLAHAYRLKVNPIVIGITGSNGKTTTKDLVTSILQTERKTHATEGNLNNHFGLPMTILQMDKDTEIAVLEMGMNNFNEISLLTKIAEPDYAIITNIGESHIENLGSREGIRDAKLEIVHGLKTDGVLIIDGDEELLHHLHKNKDVISCGFGESNDVVITDVNINEQTTTFKINNKQYSIPLLGKHHAKNSSFAVTVANQLKYKQESIKKGLKSVQHTAMRFEWINGKNGSTIINDAYNASATSMKAAIDVVKQLTSFTTKIVVLGDILELGSYAEELHRSVAEAIDSTVQAVFTFGEHASEITEQVKTLKPHITSQHFTSKDELINELNKHLQKDTLLLFKASRGMKFEELIEQITE